MKIAVEGCAHGELEKIYETILDIEKAENIKVDLLLCCGDFQATRNLEDMQTMAVPDKYKDMCTFYKYYSGECVAPILTIFVGGNHEASNHLQELPYGGWVAPNIYYLGYAGVIRLNGIRIGGISGIYKGHDYLRGRFEYCPFTESTKKSVYHVRQLEVFRLMQLSGDIDIFISHDWPQGIYNYGNKAQLLRFKPYLRDDMESDKLGSKPCEELLKKLQPSYWFSAHLHCKFAALVDHRGQNDMENTEKERITKFLALDKCLPKRRFLQVLDIESADHTDDGELTFEYDLEWLTILYLTNHLTNVKNQYYYLPGRGSAAEEKHMFTPNEEELEHIRKKFLSDLRIPKNFVRTVEPYDPTNVTSMPVMQPKSFINPQTTQFCDLLGIDDPLSLAMMISGHELSHSSAYDTSSDVLFNDSSILNDSQSLNSSSCADSNTSKISPHKLKSSLNLPVPKTNNLNVDDPNKSLNPDELNLDLNSDDDSQNEGGEHTTHNPENIENTHSVEPCSNLNKADSADKLSNLKKINLDIDDDMSNENMKGNNSKDSPTKIDVLNSKQTDNQDDIKIESNEVGQEKSFNNEVECLKTKQDDLAVLPTKKFKRRNMNLYKADSEGEN